jgi:hypothetical protein
MWLYITSIKRWIMLNVLVGHTRYTLCVLSILKPSVTQEVQVYVGVTTFLVKVTLDWNKVE